MECVYGLVTDSPFVTSTGIHLYTVYVEVRVRLACHLVFTRTCIMSRGF